MKIMRTYKFRLKPTPEQEVQFRTICAGVRTIYNTANEQRRMYGRRQGTDLHGRNSYFNYMRQSKEIRQGSSTVETAWKTNQVFTPLKKKDGSTRHKYSMSVLATETHKFLGVKGDPDLEWLARVPGDSVTYALMDLDQAWGDYFKNIAEGVSTNLPAYRVANTHNSFKMRVWAKGAKTPKNPKGLNPVCLFGRAHVRLPETYFKNTTDSKRARYVRYVKHRKLKGSLKEATIILEGNKWYICVSAEIEIRDPAERPANHIGVDLGTHEPIALSDGTAYEFVKTSKKDTKRQKDLQRKLKRAQKGSARRRKVKAELARLSRKEAAQKRAQLHAITTNMVKEFTHIAREDLDVKNMTRSAKNRRKRGQKTASNKTQAAFNRAFLEVPKYAFGAMLEYKAPAYGTVVQTVPPEYTSQTCSACGNVSKAARVTRDKYICTVCGHTEHADLNAAKNIVKIAFPNSVLTSTGVVAGDHPRLRNSVVTPRKTPSEQCQWTPLVVDLPSATSKPVGSLFEGRVDPQFDDNNTEFFATESTGYG